MAKAGQSDTATTGGIAPGLRLTIRTVRARAVDVRIKQPAVTAAGTFASFPVVLIDVHTEEGVFGRTYIFAYERFALKPLVLLIEAMGDLLRGQRLHPLAVETFLQRRMRLLGAQGLVGMALGGIDMVMWDAAARAADVPLAMLLGAAPRPIPAYGTLKNMTAEGAARDAAAAVAYGFAGVKVKMGGSTVDADVAVIEAIRREVGPRIAIMVDYNQVLSVPEAIARGRVLDEHHVTWIEEPTLARDFEGHAEIARHVATPISVGESWEGVADAMRSMACRASDFIMPDAMRIGGVTGWMRTAALAQAHGVPLSGHALPELSLHLLAATPTAHWLEYADIVEAIVQQPLALRDGCAVLPDGPGFGLEWDERAVDAMLA
jgi:mandelate racemase